MTLQFVTKDSIVREIWSNPDTILFIFAGAAAEFAVNKAVDWLYFTGKLPADPLGRLFSTVVYAQKIIFSDLDGANRAIDQITDIHKTVEQNRGKQIPDWAYRDVLFMLIFYSVTSFEALYRKLSGTEKDDIYDVFYRVGNRMGLTNLPNNYREWTIAHENHLVNDTLYSDFTTDLYKQYRRHLGFSRYQILKQVQLLIMPAKIKLMLKFKLGPVTYIKPVLFLFKVSRIARLNNLIISMVLPNQYRKQLKSLHAK